MGGARSTLSKPYRTMARIAAHPALVKSPFRLTGLQLGNILGCRFDPHGLASEISGRLWLGSYVSPLSSQSTERGHLVECPLLADSGRGLEW